MNAGREGILSGQSVRHRMWGQTTFKVPVESLITYDSWIPQEVFLPS